MYRKKKKPEPAPTFPLSSDQKKERKNCALDPLPVLKIPLSQGTQNFPFPKTEGNQKLPFPKTEGNKKLPFFVLCLSNPSHRKAQNKKYKENSWEVKTGTTQNTHTTNIYFPFFTVRVWEGFSCVGGVVVVRALTDTLFPLGDFVKLFPFVVL